MSQIKIAFLEHPLIKKVLPKWLNEKTNYRQISMFDLPYQTLSKICHSQEETKMKNLKKEIEQLDSTFWLKLIEKRIFNINDIIITNVTTSLETSYLLNKGFIVLKIFDGYEYPPDVEGVKTYKIDYDPDYKDEVLIEILDSIVENFDNLLLQRYKGTKITYVEDNK